MRFKLLLWIMGFLLERASKNNAKFQNKLAGKELTLEISSEDGVARHFIFRQQRILSYPGRASAPAFLGGAHEPDVTIRFRKASCGFKTFTAKDKQLAMMGGIEDKKITIEGNSLYLMWFQGLASMLGPK